MANKCCLIKIWQFCKKHICSFSFFVSVVAIFISIFRCKPIEVEWISVLVGILSLLVTVLIGLNVFTLIDFKQKLSEAKTHYDTLQNKTEEINQIAFDANIATNYTLYLLFNQQEKFAGAITAIIQSLCFMVTVDAKANKEAGNINRYSDYLVESIQKYKENGFGENNIRIISESLAKIKSSEDYVYLKDLFNESFNKIEELIREEKLKEDQNEKP